MSVLINTTQPALGDAQGDGMQCFGGIYKRKSPPSENGMALGLHSMTGWRHIANDLQIHVSGSFLQTSSQSSHSNKWAVYHVQQKLPTWTWHSEGAQKEHLGYCCLVLPWFVGLNWEAWEQKDWWKSCLFCRHSLQTGTDKFIQGQGKIFFSAFKCSILVDRDLSRVFASLSPTSCVQPLVLLPPPQPAGITPMTTLPFQHISTYRALLELTQDAAMGCLTSHKTSPPVRDTLTSFNCWS